MVDRLIRVNDKSNCILILIPNANKCEQNPHGANRIQVWAVLHNKGMDKKTALRSLITLDRITAYEVINTEYIYYLSQPRPEHVITIPQRKVVPRQQVL
jgi:hypothetical protein